MSVRWIGIAALLPILGMPAVSRAQSAGAPGCGDPSVKFEVKTTQDKPAAKPAAGKALVYVLQNDENFNSTPKPTSRIGLDGEWVGATHKESYITFEVDPGEHHLCSAWQFSAVLGSGHRAAAAHFTAMAGGAYYFEIKDLFFRGDHGQNVLETALRPMDSDEGQLLVNSYSLSISKPKK